MSHFSNSKRFDILDCVLILFLGSMKENKAKKCGQAISGFVYDKWRSKNNTLWFAFLMHFFLSYFPQKIVVPPFFPFSCCCYLLSMRNMYKNHSKSLILKHFGRSELSLFFAYRSMIFDLFYALKSMLTIIIDLFNS